MGRMRINHLLSSCRRCFSSGVDADPLNILLVMGSSRATRIGEKVAIDVSERIRSRGHALSVLDPRESHDGFFMRLMEKAHFHYKDGEAVPAALEAAAVSVRAADAFVVVTPEMNHTISPALTNTMNYFGGSLYANKASGIVTYSAGMWGGARCGAALRVYLSELGCLPVSATGQLAGAWKRGTFDADTGLLASDSMGAKLTERMLDQLEFTAHALRTQRRRNEAAATASAEG
jgi:chromate reductase